MTQHAGHGSRNGKGRKKVALFGCLGALVLTGACFAFCVAVFNSAKQQPAKEPTPAVERGAPSPSPTPERPLEYKLAVLNAGGVVRDDDVSVIRFRYLLSSLKGMARGYTEQQIGDLTYAGAQMVHNRYGVDVSLLEFMERCNREMQLKPKLDLKVAIALIVVSYA